MRDIVRRTELASGTFYNYFPDKASIFRAHRRGDRRGGAPPRPRRARCRPPAPEGFVEGGFRAFFEFIASDPGDVRVPAPQPRHDPRAVRGRGAARRDRRARGRPARRDRPRRAAAGRRRLLRARDDRGRAGARPAARSSATRRTSRAPPRFATALFVGRAGAPGTAATLTRHALPPHPASCTRRRRRCSRVPAAAQAKLTVGIAENNPQHVRRPAVHAARRQARARSSSRGTWSPRATTRSTASSTTSPAPRAAGVTPLVTFEHARGDATICNKRKNRKKAQCKLPTAKQYETTTCARSRRAFPTVRNVVAWNEINHFTQPTYKNPKAAAKFTTIARKVFKGGTVVAADILDQADNTRAKRPTFTLGDALRQGVPQGLQGPAQDLRHPQLLGHQPLPHDRHARRSSRRSAASRSGSPRPAASTSSRASRRPRSAS